MKIKLKEDLAYSCALIYNRKEKKIIEETFLISKPLITEYFPTILFLNQTPIYIDLINKLNMEQDCFIVNSSGQIHPFYYGTACDLGLQIDTPVIGYTKSLLFGEIRENNADSDFKEIVSENRLLGYAIPKPGSAKYYYVSIGNKVSPKTLKNLFKNFDLNVINQLNRSLDSFIKTSI